MAKIWQHTEKTYKIGFEMILLAGIIESSLPNMTIHDKTRLRHATNPF